MQSPRISGPFYSGKHVWLIPFLYVNQSPSPPPRAFLILGATYMQDIISTLKNALQQAEAGLEVAVGRLAKDGTERGDFKPSEVLALACVREALAMPVSCLHQIQEPSPVPTEIITALWEAIGHHSAQVAETGEMAPGQKLLDAARAVEMAIRPPAIATLPKSIYLEGVNITNLREALIFLGRENGVGEGEVGDKLAQYVNSVVSGVLSKKTALRAADRAAPDETQIKALMRKHRIWIEHSTLFEDDEPPRELRAVQAEQHQFEAFVQDLIALAATQAAQQADEA